MHNMETPITDHQKDIVAARAQVEKDEADVLTAHTGVKQIERQLDALKSSNYNGINDNQIAKLESDYATRNADLQQKVATFTSSRKNCDDLIVRVLSSPPQQLVEKLSDEMPFLLFPVKIETRFMNTNGKAELWLRIFPDDVVIHTHERELTPEENSAGTKYWNDVFAAGTNEDLKQGIWTVLANTYGGNRALWIARETKPGNWGSVTNAADFIFPAPATTRNSSWSRAPRSKVLPDKFVFTGQLGNETLTHVGNPVPDSLRMGPDPAGVSAGISRDETTADISFTGDIEWMADFRKAVSVGMGMIIPLDPPFDTNGFDRVTVLGLKLSSDHTHGAVLLEELFENHHYGADGFSFVKQGTPTNNTEEQPSGFTSFDAGNELSYLLQNTTTSFTPSAVEIEKPDAQRFADLLGIGYDSLQLLPNSDLKDVREAMAMNIALSPGTIGYYMDEMLEKLVSDEFSRDAKAFFNNYVTGRGPLPAFRTGNQPYGVLVTSDFNAWTWSIREVGKNGGFLAALQPVLKQLQAEWERLRPQVKHASGSGNAAATLLNILALHPTSVEYHQRIATDDLTTWNYLNMAGNGTLSEFWWGIRRFIHQLLASGIGIPGDKIPRVYELEFLSRLQLLDGGVVDELPLSEDREINPYDGTNNYIDWLLNSNFETIKKQEFKNAAGETVRTPSSLLYLLLRNAYLQANAIDVKNLLLERKISQVQKVRDKSIVNVEGNEMSRMDYLKMDMQHVAPELNLGRPTMAGDFVKGGLINEQFRFAETASVTTALRLLSGLSTASLERLFAEHVDLCSYRLDAWQTGMFTHRLAMLRKGANERKTGVYLGAFGWVENLRPATGKRTPLPASALPPELAARNTQTVYEHTGNGGFIHGPSVNHAVAGAVLRSGYLTHATSADREKMSVQLTSDRVRMATHYIDGLRNGQTLSSLLGYQFERGLHDRSTDALHLDQYIYAFRKKFPLVQSGVEPVAGEAAEVIAVRNVVDGNLLLKAASTSSYPYGVADLPASGSSAASTIIDEINKLKAAFDAIGDVVMSESVFQTVQGNFDRAGAVMKAFSEGNHIPEPDVIKTPYNGRLITHRVTLHFDGNAANPWGFDLTPRANAEKGMNKWIADLLDDPQKIKCQVFATWNDVNGAITEMDDVTLAMLNIHAIDFVLMSGDDLGSGQSEVERRIAYWFRTDRGISDDVQVEIDFTGRGGSWDADVRTFFEIMPLVKSLRNVITSSRALNASDLDLPSKAQKREGSNPKGYDLHDLINDGTDGLAQGRVRVLFAKLQEHFAALALLPRDVSETAATAITDTQLTQMRERLKLIADYGIQEAFPQSATGNSLQVKQTLAQQVSSVYTQIEKTLDSAEDLLTFTHTTPLPADAKERRLEELRRQEELVMKYTEAARVLCGKSFNLLPRFSIANADAVRAAVDNERNLLRHHEVTLGNPLPVQEWLQSAACVRKPLSDVETIGNYAFTAAVSMNPAALQLPVNTAHYWVAAEYPEAFEIESDTLCLAAFLPAAFDAAATTHGLLVDDFSEVIPGKSETTGISFHYDQPNATPPQSLLLAVAPALKGHWTWSELQGILNDTLDRAKRRAVEPDLLSNSLYSQVLPGILPAYTANTEMIATDLSKNRKRN